MRYLLLVNYFMKEKLNGAWVVQSVKCPTLGFHSSHDLMGHDLKGHDLLGHGINPTGQPPHSEGVYLKIHSLCPTPNLYSSSLSLSN